MLWQLEPADVYAKLATEPEGLTGEEAHRRLERYGPNSLPRPPVRPVVLRLLDQVRHPMALMLWVAGLMAFPAGMPELGLAIWGVVAINGVFGFWQEFQAERAMESLQKVLPQRVRVWRDGSLTTMEAADLVPGDVVELEVGERVCADARLVWAEGLSLDVSVLTGESPPVAREASPARPRELVAVRAGQSLAHGETRPRERVSPAEIRNFVLAGSLVSSGRGRAVIFATGGQTEFGHVARLTTAVPRERSTLEVQIEKVVRTLTRLSLGIGLAVFGLTYLVVGLGFLPSLLFAIGMIVANVPEGFLPTVTLSLAVAVQRMARRKALVRRLSAIETLSAATVVCTDKTGTLTQGRMSVRCLWLPGRGEVESDRLLLTTAALCSNGGAPTEEALIQAALPFGPSAARARLREVPFDSRRRLMTVVVPGAELWPEPVAQLALTKGAALEVLRRCRAVRQGDENRPLDRVEVEAAIGSLADRAFRVLAVAARPGAELEELEPQALEQELILLGLIALYDPPRAEVPDAIEQCHRAGLRVNMVTGDNGRTARAIAVQIGLRADRVVSGDELDHLTEAQLRSLLQSVPELIFARVMPEQKLRLVRAYQDLGEIVAVTGDGVNDAPALRAAHIGIAMGLKGTDVAREAADIVLLDDNFASLVTAIEEGRAVYANIRRFLTYVLSSNVPEMLPFLAMIVFGIPPALTILQILAVDLGTDMVPALALGTERAEPGVMSEPPRRSERPLLDRSLLLRAYGYLGLIEGAAALSSFALVWWSHGYGLASLQGVTQALLSGTAAPDVVAVWRQSTTLTLAAIVACQIGNALVCRSRGAWWRNRLLWLGIGLEVVALLVITRVGWVQEMLQTAPLAGWHWLWLALWPLVMVGAGFKRG